MKKNIKPMLSHEITGGKDMDIEFNEAQNIANQMVEKANNIKTELNRITESVLTMSKEWESSKSVEAQKICTEFTETFDNFYRVIKATPEKIIKVANELKRAEQN